MWKKKRLNRSRFALPLIIVNIQIFIYFFAFAKSYYRYTQLFDDYLINFLHSWLSSCSHNRWPCNFYKPYRQIRTTPIPFYLFLISQGRYKRAYTQMPLDGNCTDLQPIRAMIRELHATRKTKHDVELNDMCYLVMMMWLFKRLHI